MKSEPLQNGRNKSYVPAGNRAPQIKPNYSREQCCWTCGERGHRRLQCKNRPEIFCSRCGTLGILSRDCPCPQQKPDQLSSISSENDILGTELDVLPNPQNNIRYFLDIALFDSTFEGLVDTGAGRSFIGEEIEQFVRTYKVPANICPLRVVLADGTGIDIDKSYELDIYIEGRSVTHVFYFMPELSEAIIFGVDFLQKCGLRLTVWRDAEIPHRYEALHRVFERRDTSPNLYSSEEEGVGKFSGQEIKRFHGETGLMRRNTKSEYGTSRRSIKGTPAKTGKIIAPKISKRKKHPRKSARLIKKRISSSQETGIAASATGIRNSTSQDTSTHQCPCSAETQWRKLPWISNLRKGPYQWDTLSKTGSSGETCSAGNITGSTHSTKPSSVSSSTVCSRNQPLRQDIAELPMPFKEAAMQLLTSNHPKAAIINTLKGLVRAKKLSAGDWLMRHQGQKMIFKP